MDSLLLRNCVVLCGFVFYRYSEPVGDDLIQVILHIFLLLSHTISGCWSPLEDHVGYGRAVLMPLERIYMSLFRFGSIELILCAISANQGSREHVGVSIEVRFRLHLR